MLWNKETKYPNIFVDGKCVYSILNCNNGKRYVDKHLKKTELRDKIGISNATLAKLGKNEPVNLKVIDAICQELNCNIEDVLEICQQGEL